MASGAVSHLRDRNRLDTFASLQDFFGSIAEGYPSPASVPEARHPVIAEDVGRALDKVLELAAPDSYTQLTDTVIDLLGLFKTAFSEKTWHAAVLPAARSHPIAQLIHECPFTRHSFTQPRGYPGDAGLLDFVYRHPAAAKAREAATDAGRTVMRLTVDVTACEAVRRRRSILAAKIDEAADRRPAPSILAVASGHLREAELSIALREGRIGRFLATDQDPTSLAVVDGYRTSIAAAIETRTLTVRNILSGKADLGSFDLVYAAGLYDYLDERVAARLTRILFDHVNAGGRLVVPNFLHGVREEAYMEVFMDWYLLYRTRQEVDGFARDIDSAKIRRKTYTEDQAGVIGYLELERA